MSVLHPRAAALFAIIFATVALFPATILYAQPAAGDLDATFGTGGTVTTDFFSDDNHAYAVAVQPDGKICVAGRTNGFGSLFGVVRYLPDGQLDPTFGSGGKAITGIIDFYNYPTAMSLQPDGKLLVGGYFLIIADELAFGLVRLNPDGQLDKSFGIDGKVTEKGVGKDGKVFRTFAGIDAQSWIRAMAVQPDGKIVIAGAYAIFPSFFTQLFVVRLNADGSLDTSFGAGGQVRRDLAFDNTNTDLLIQSDGKIVIAGSSKSQSYQCVLMRLNSDGSPDAAFGSAGMIATQFGGLNARYAALAATSDGKYILAGSVNRAQSPSLTADDFALARFNKDGSMDMSFGTGGVVIKDVSLNDRVRDLLMQPDGKILLAGYSGVDAVNAALPSEARLALLRFNADGSEDAGFNVKDVTGDESRLSLASALALQTDGRIVIAGSVGSNASGYDFLVARFSSGLVIPSPFTIKAAALRKRASGALLDTITVKANGKKFDLIVSEDSAAPAAESLGAAIHINGAPFETEYTTSAAGAPVFVARLKRDTLAQPGTLKIEVVRSNGVRSNQLTLQLLPATP